MLFGRLAAARTGKGAAGEGSAGDDESAGLLVSSHSGGASAAAGVYGVLPTGLRIEGYRCVATGPSDHYPVVASFVLGGSSSQE